MYFIPNRNCKENVCNMYFHNDFLFKDDNSSVVKPILNLNFKLSKIRIVVNGNGIFDDYPNSVQVNSNSVQVVVNHHF